MFAPVVGFEDFSLRVEVEWLGAKRFVVVRLERWPNSHRAVLVCALEDNPDGGEWLVLQNVRSRPYHMDQAGKAMVERTGFDLATRRPTSWIVLRDERIKKLKNIVQRAFEGRDFNIGRVLQLPELPDEPRLALWSLARSFWCRDWSLQNPTPFEFATSPLPLIEQQTREQLLL